MDPSLWLPQQVNPLTWLAAGVFLIPVVYLIVSSIRDRSLLQFGGGLVFLGIIVLVAFHRLLGALTTVAGIVIVVVAIALPRMRGERQDFQLD